MDRSSMVERVNLSWSGGKDSALAFRELSRDPRYEVRSLLTTVTEGYDRISMHGVRIPLLDQQANALRLPLVKVPIPQSANNEQYESKMREALARERANGVTTVAFGDIFLEDIRRYREEKLSQVGMKAIFPIWKRDTRELALEFINAGFRAILTCVDSKQLDGSFVGRTFDRSLLEDLPSKVDPCGENGEFHTFVYSGPIFSQPIPVRKGEIVLRENRFYYCDLLPKVEE
ncbi:MAG TPA: diphthine--ammonia ligase [Candidatus Acidoferrum sp.]|nr:diphthine--ammonia ligase [Candidatus Acidoferrum sp.]